ncbi:MAG: hypothetical protein ACI9S8_001449 [Chlamydiales bacterium]|jgi:hypothetical protein
MAKCPQKSLTASSLIKSLYEKFGMAQYKVTLFPKPIGFLTKISDDLREAKGFVIM